MVMVKGLKISGSAVGLRIALVALAEEPPQK